MGLLAWIAVGFISGILARVIVRPRRRLGCSGTILLGVAGSLVGGTLANLLAGDGFDVSGAGIVGSVFGAIVILLVAGRNRPPQWP